MQSHSHRHSLTALAGLLIAAAVLAAPAGAAPLPKRATAYLAPEKQRVSLNLVTNATNAKKIQPGSAPLGSQFVVGGIFVSCPSAPRSGSFAPFTTIPFPALTLTLSHGHYGFSKRLKLSRTLLASSLSEAVKLSVLFTGTVVSPTLITGTVKIAGKQCATTAKYAAKQSKTAQVAPGQ